jgi:hypothetical protein
MISLFSYSSVINFNFGLFIRVRIINWDDWHSLWCFLGLMKCWFDINGFTDRFLGFKTRKDSLDKVMWWIPSYRCLLLVVECFTWITMRSFVIEDQRGCGCCYLSRLWYVPWSFCGFSNILVIVAVDDFLLIHILQIVFQMVVLYFDILVTACTLA